MTEQIEEFGQDQPLGAGMDAGADHVDLAGSPMEKGRRSWFSWIRRRRNAAGPALVSQPEEVETSAEAANEPGGPAGGDAAEDGRASGEKQGGKRRGKGSTASRAGRKDGLPPLQVIVEWMAHASEKDVSQHARGYIQDHFGSLENAWIATAPFMDGYFFEIHEGGDGRSHLPAIVEALTDWPDQMVWLSSGSKINRAITVSVEEGVPSTVVLNEDDTARVRDSGQPPLARGGRMQPAVRKGERMLAAGVAVAGIGFIVMATTMTYSLMSPRFIAEARQLNAQRLPVHQIPTIAKAAADTYLERLVFENGNWVPTWRSIPSIALPDEEDGAREMIERILSDGFAERSGHPAGIAPAGDSQAPDIGPGAGDEAAAAARPPAVDGGADSDFTSRIEAIFDEPAQRPDRPDESGPGPDGRVNETGD